MLQTTRARALMTLLVPLGISLWLSVAGRGVIGSLFGCLVLLLIGLTLMLLHS